MYKTAGTNWNKYGGRRGFLSESATQRPAALPIYAPVEHVKGAATILRKKATTTTAPATTLAECIKGDR